jgi:uncharacterized protein
MTHPDFDSARDYALYRLRDELSPRLTYHSLWHTAEDVFPAVERLAKLANITDLNLLLLRTAAIYHDVGFIEMRDGHELASKRIASEALPRFNYSLPQIELIGGMIMATRLPQSPRTLLESLMADADLDALGRTDFIPRNRALRTEMAAFGTHHTDDQWRQVQLTFVSNHRYFTEAARSLRNEQKQRNLESLLAGNGI